MRVHTLGYVGVESPEVKQWEEFGPEILGLQLVDGDLPGSVYLRMDERHHRIAIHPGPKDRMAYVGWEMAGDDDLAEAADDLARAGYAIAEGTEEECEERAVRRLVSVTDPGGARHEFFYGQLSLPGQFQPGRPLSGFVTGEQGLGHVVCVVPDLAAATRFYKMLGFKKSDEIYAFIDAHFFHCNPRHHSLALTEIPRVRGLHHIMIQLESLDDVGLAYDLVQARGIPLTMTLGRHPNDRMVSFYVRSPSGFEIEYGWGALEVGEDWTVTQYDAVSVWGHKMVGTSPPGALEEALQETGKDGSGMGVKFLTDDWAKALTEGCNANAKFTKHSKGIAATFQINVTGSPEADGFTMEWAGGTVHVTTGHHDDADVNLDFDYPTMVELSKGTMNGPQAVATGRMKAAGNMEKMFNLGKAMDLLPVIEAEIGLSY